MKQGRTISILSVILFFLTISLNAQEKVKEFVLKSIQGTAIGNDNESVNQVVQRAVDKSKIEALKRAGIEESIASYSDFIQYENEDSYAELFTSDILSDIRGAVKDIEITETKKVFDEFGKLNVEVSINCTVVKYISDKDLSFDVWVDGVGMYYLNETKLTFNVKPSKDAYVKIFIFNETEAFQLFPNDVEKSYLLEKGVQYIYPSSKVDYILETNKKSEPHRMIMIFTKEDIPYTNKVKYRQIIDWVFSIPPDMRVVKSFGFNVVNEN